MAENPEYIPMLEKQNGQPSVEPSAPSDPLLGTAGTTGQGDMVTPPPSYDAALSYGTGASFPVGQPGYPPPGGQYPVPAYPPPQPAPGPVYPPGQPVYPPPQPSDTQPSPYPPGASPYPPPGSGAMPYTAPMGPGYAPPPGDTAYPPGEMPAATTPAASVHPVNTCTASVLKDYNEFTGYIIAEGHREPEVIASRISSRCTIFFEVTNVLGQIHQAE